jgi:hypothetical protein
VKRRTALKICRDLFDQSRPWRRHPLRRFTTNREAIAIGRRHWRDERFPYIPSDDEQVEGFGFVMSALIDGLAPNDDAANEAKGRLWEAIT